MRKFSILQNSVKSMKALRAKTIDHSQTAYLMRTFLRQTGFFAIALIANLFFITAATAQVTRTYNTSGAGQTFIVPAGVTSVTVSAWGGGGAGGGSNNATGTTARGGAGGGGGAYAQAALNSLTPGSTLTVTVAASVAGVSAGNGNNGNFSTIVGFEGTIYAAGGSGGNANTTGNTPTGGPGGVNVAPTQGTTKTAGSPGSNGATGLGISSGAGGNAANTAGGGGTGGASVGGTGSNGPGTTGNAPGGGGSGSRTSQTGGNQTGGPGAAGRVTITWTCPTYSLTNPTSATSQCASQAGTVTLSSSAAGLPVGTYSVTYNLSAPNTATGLTATMTVSVAGSGTFTIPGASLTNNGNTTVTVTQLASGGGAGTFTPTTICTSTISTNNTAAFDVSPTANAGAALSAICQGGTSAALIGTVGGGATGGTWSTVSGGTFTPDNLLSSNPTWTPPPAFSGTATLVLTTTGGACTPATASKTQLVNPTPVPTFTASATATTCQNSSVTYTTQAGALANSYVWSVPGTGGGVDYTITSGGIGAGSNTVTLTWISTGSKNVTVTYTSAAGCAATTSASNTTNVVARPTPTFDVTPTSPQCWNTNVTYTTQAGAQANSYVWAYPGSVLNTDYTITSGGTTASNTVTLKWLTAGSRTVTANYNDATTGCSGAPVASSTITVNKTIASFISSPGSGSCTTVDITYTTQPGESNYAWNIQGVLNTDYSITSTVPSGGTVTSATTSVTLKWLTTGVKAVTVSYTDANNCTSSVASSSTTVNSFPTPSFTASPAATSCTAVDITYTTQSGFTGYTWSIPGALTTDYTITSTVPAGGTVTSSTTSVTLKWVTTGSKTVTVNYSSGVCPGVSPASSNTIVGAIPAAPGAISGPTAACAGLASVYSVTNDPTVTTYNWTLPVGSGWTGSSTTNSISATAGTSGGLITVTATNSCGTSPGIAGQSASIKPLTSVGVFNTGYTNGTTKFDGNITVSSTPNRGFIKFPLSSSLPTGATVTASTLNLTNTGAGSTSANTGSTITGLGNYDLVGNSASAVSTAVSGGTVYSSGIAWTYPGTFGLTLNAAANTAITSLISSGNIVLGLNRTSATAFIFFGYAGGASAPNLAVTYTGPRNLAVTITSTPATPSAITGAATVCPNTGSLTYSVTNDPTATSYTWTIPTGWSGTSTTNSITLTSGNTGDNGNITVTANNACGSSTPQVLAVTVGSVPANPVNPTSNSPQCADVGVTLDRVTLDPSPDTWYWQGTTSLGTNTGLGSGQTFTATASGTYHIRARSTAGCWSAGEGSVAVVVNALPIAPGNPSSNSPQCADVGVTLTRAASPGAGLTFYWQGTNATGTSTAHSGSSYNTKTDFPDGVSGTYYIRARTDLPAGCWSATGGTGSLAVVVNPLPTGVSATPVPTAVCVGTPVSLTAGATLPGAGSVLTTAFSEDFENTGTVKFTVATPTNINSGQPWQTRTNPYVNTLTWNSSANGNTGQTKFWMPVCQSGNNTTMTTILTMTNSINTTGYTSLNLTFIFPAQWDPKLGIHVT